MAKKNSSDNNKIVPSYREQGKLLASKSDKTLGYDKEVVDRIGAGAEGEFSGLQETYGQKDEHFFDPYENHVNRNTLRGGQFSVEELNKIRATNQSNWDQAGNAVARVAVNVVPQIVSGFSSMVDLPGYWDSEHAAQNSIVNWAQDLKKEVDEDWFPIYEESPQSMNISDPAWWMSRGSGLVESVGSFLAQGAGMGKVLSVGLKGAASLAKGKDLARMIMGAQKSKQLLQGTTGLANAVALNQSEAVISATQVFNDTYQDNLTKGYSIDKAKAMAAQAASTTMNLNRINILLNLSSASAFITPLKSTRQLLKQASKTAVAGKLVAEGVQEGTEELINLVAEKAGTAKGKGKDYTLENALEDMGTMEGFEAAFLGAIGGIAQTGGTKALEYSKYGPGNTLDANGNKISKATYEKEQYAKQQEIINDLKEKGVNSTDILKNFRDNLVLQAKFTAASEAGNTEEVEKLKEQIFENQAIRSFESGTTETLEELYKAEAEKNPEEVGQEYVDNAKNAIVKLKELEAVYNNFEDYANVDEIFFNRSNKIRLEAIAKNTENLKKQADFQLSKDLHTVAAKYTYNREREILIKKDGEVTGTEKVIDKVPLSYSTSDLENNQGRTEEEQAVYNKFLAEVKALPSFKAATNIEENSSKLENEILNNSKEFEEITSPNYQKKAEQRKIESARIKEAHAALPKINNISEIEKLRDSIDDKDFKEAANKKIASLVEDNNIAAKNKQTTVVVNKLNDKIKNATLENIEEISDEISKAEISQDHKTNLNNALNVQVGKLTGEPVEEEETEEEEEEDPLANFSSKTPEELAAEVEAENKSFATNIPKDFPNPNSEKETVENEVANAAQKLASEDKTMIIGQDEQGNLIYGYARSAEGHNRAAYLSREFNQTEATGKVDREELGNSLDNIELLNPDFLTEGTALNMAVDIEYEGDKYDPNSDTRQKTPWVLRKIELQKLAEARGIPLTELDEYIEEVPIKVTTDAGDTVFYVHDNSWYKEENLSATAEEIDEDREKNFKIRKAIVSKGVPVKTKVSYKSFGKLFKSFDGKAIAVSEAMPDPNLIFAVGRNGTFKLPGDASIVLKGGTILKSTATDGRVYAIVKVGPKEYLPIPLERQPISQEIIDTVMFAIEAHLTGDSENAVVKAIAESSLGLDITTLPGLSKYLNQFIYLFPTDQAASLESYLIRGGSETELKSNMPLISVTATGIEFGRPGVNMGSHSKNGVKVVKASIVLSQNFKSKVGEATNKAGLSKLRATLEQFTPLSNASRKDLAANKDSIILLDNAGATKTVKYSQVVKDSHKTNILSVNVGSEENPVWAYTIQPTILFDTAFAKLDKGKKKRAARPRAKAAIAKGVTTAPITAKKVTSTVALTNQIAAEAEIETRRQKELFLTENKLYANVNLGQNPTEALLKKQKEIDEFNKDIQEKRDKINAKYDAELAALEKQPIEEEVTAEEEVETLTEEALIESCAKSIIANGTNLTELNGILESFDLGAISEELVLQANFTSLEQAQASYAKAKEIFIANSKETKTITLPNGLVIKANKNDVDSNPLEEDETDELVSEMTPEQLNAQREEIDEMIVRGLDTATQSSLIAYLSSDIVNEGLKAKEVAGKKQVQVKPILDKHLESFKQLSKFYKEQGLVNKAARLDSVIAQFDKVRRLVNQNMSKFSTGDVSEDVELDSNEGVSGLVRTAYTDDWAFTVSAKSTSSADLKKFFSIVQAQDEEGPMVNLLGLPEILSYDVVFNTLQELLTNIPADYSTMLDILELHQKKFPWIKSAIAQLEAAPEKIQNEFVSAMTKHHINMQFIMWSKDYKGNYSLQKWSSNSSSIEQRLKTIWNSNLKGVATQSNLITVNEDDEYVFNEVVAKGLKDQAAEWAKNPAEVTNDELAIWLGNFGIVLTDKTYEDLRKGKFNNNGRKPWNALFTNGAGLVKALSTALDKKVKGKVNFEDSELLNDSVVKALAKLEATNNLNTFSNSFQAGGKTIYSYGNNNFLINRMRDLTAYNSEDGTFLNPDLIKSLQDISFTKNSSWLADLTNKEDAGIAMRNNFKLNYLSLEALKKAFTKSQDNRKLNNLTTAEHEVAKIAFFQNVSGDNINGEDRRIVDFFYPTMSDKTTMLTISSLARELKLENGEISLENLELLYNVLVVPEINRIRDRQSTNTKGYEPNYFYFLHSLNTLNIDSDAGGKGRTFLDIVKDKDDTVYSLEVKAAVLAEIKGVFDNLLTDKLADWDKLGIGKIIIDDKGRVTDNYSFLDKEYMTRVAKGTGASKTKYAAADYIFNYLIANAEAHKLFAGDPALYAKFNSKKSLTENLSETFTNIGKRLAGDIAPGMELANSANNKYYQVFFEDEKMESNNVKDSAQKEFFSKIIKDFANNYSGIEGSDAQEYTTWKEHLYVMKQLGRLTSVQYKDFYKKLEAQSKGDFRESNKLSYEEMGIIMQPMKPVYVGNTASVKDNADTRVYIKSSSFPLLPELTAGMQIDKIRKGLETFETKIGSKVTADGTPAFVRASFGTANKVGAIKNAAKVFDKDGNVLDNLVFTEENALLLSRQNFRIQQDVPYKREKDSVNIGTQERKLLFVNTLDLEIEPGVKGNDLMVLYNKNYLELYEYAHEELSNKLGLVEEVSSKADITSLLTIPDSTIFDQNEILVEKLKGASPVTKVQLQQDFAEEMGDNTLERVNFINKNFDSIIESLVAANMNVFFDENKEFKKC